jgi:hypothetical protein
MLTFKYKFYERSPDGLLKQPQTFGPYYEQDDSLRGYFDTEQDAKNAVLNLNPEYQHYAAELILVQEVVHSYD